MERARYVSSPTRDGATASVVAVMSVEGTAKTPRLPPRWFIRVAWAVHRAVYRVFRGRVGLWRPRPNGWGTLRLTTTGRRSGRQRSVIIGYFEDGPNLVSLEPRDLRG